MPQPSGKMFRLRVSCFPLRLIGAMSFCTAALTSCGTPPAQDFGGFWKPVNRFDSKVNEIPLATPYVYYASPTDGTLRSMLTRWGADTGVALSYGLRSDFTLPKTAARIRTSEARDAAAQLSDIYAAQGIRVAFEGTQLVVEETRPPSDAADGARVP